jgi:hypothetical protein
MAGYIQEKFDNVSPSAMLFPLDPRYSAVKVTIAPVESAVTPVVVAVHLLIAAAKFVASVTLLLLLAKVPVVELGQVLVPADPAVTVPHEKRPTLCDAPIAR